MADHPLYSAFGRAVERAIKADPRVILITCDTARDHFAHHLQKEYPLQAIDVGIAEQHAVSMASALAISGMKPIVCTYARFLTRAYEQIYNQMSEHTAVVYVGSLAGPLPPDGPGVSHEALEDFSAMGGLGLACTEPSVEQVDLALRLALRGTKSWYVRLRHV